jgi:hypothetical protein
MKNDREVATSQIGEVIFLFTFFPGRMHSPNEVQTSNPYLYTDRRGVALLDVLQSMGSNLK